MTTTPAKPLDLSTRLALDRTRLAHERTLMAWVRTAVSLISFGFTIYKFFEFEAGRAGPAGRHLLTPREFAMIMIGTGLVALALSTIDHRRYMKHIRSEYEAAPRSLTLVVAAIVSVMGLLAFFATLFGG
jgi:inner membrane protein YidH